MRKETFVKGEYYHIYDRGVDKRTIFTTDREKIRFIHSLYTLNNFVDIPHQFDLISLEPRKLLTPTPPLVKIVAGCLMSNHYHLMIAPIEEKGVSKFFHKVNSSHTHYFNNVHERSGRLFESTFKAKHIDKHEYANYLTYYFHIKNPLDLYRSKIGTDKNEEKQKILERLKNYKWSSLPVYLNKQCYFSCVVSSEFRDKVMGTNAKEYNDFVEELFEELYRS